MASALQHYIQLYHLDKAMEAAPDLDAAEELRVDTLRTGRDVVEVEGTSKPRSETLRRKLHTGNESIMDFVKAVSYTHLTLPTNREV